MREVSVNGPLRSHAKGAFCAGADLKERAKMTPDEVRFFTCPTRECKWGFRCLEVLGGGGGQFPHIEENWTLDSGTGWTLCCAGQGDYRSLGEASNACDSCLGRGKKS